MSQDAAISISREGQALGTWASPDIARMLQVGVLSPSDHFWREGMAEWSTLADFVLPSIPGPPPPPPPVVHSYPVVFGSAMGVDKLGFVRAGDVRASDDGIELAGLRHWSAWARLGIFLVAAPLLWGLFGMLSDTLPRDGGALLAVFGICLGLFTIVGVPLLILTLMHYFCVSPATLHLRRGDIRDVVRKGREITFLATVAPGRTRKARWRASSSTEAAELARRLVV